MSVNISGDILTKTWPICPTCYRYFSIYIITTRLHNIYQGKKNVSMFAIFPRGCFAFNFSYLTWKPIWWVCLRYFERNLYLNYFFSSLFCSPIREYNYTLLYANLPCNNHSQSPVFGLVVLYPTGSEISRFWFIKTLGKEKIAIEYIFFAILTSTLWRFYWANKKICLTL